MLGKRLRRILGYRSGYRILRLSTTIRRLAALFMGCLFISSSGDALGLALDLAGRG